MQRRSTIGDSAERDEGGRHRLTRSSRTVHCACFQNQNLQGIGGGLRADVRVNSAPHSSTEELRVRIECRENGFTPDATPTAQTSLTSRRRPLKPAKGPSYRRGQGAWVPSLASKNRAGKCRRFSTPACCNGFAKAIMDRKVPKLTSLVSLIFASWPRPAARRRIWIWIWSNLNYPRRGSGIRLPFCAKPKNF